MNFIALKTSGSKLIAKLFYVLFFKKLCNLKKFHLWEKKSLEHIKVKLNTSTFIFSWRYYIALQLM
jgi:hypothetical protein